MLKLKRKGRSSIGIREKIRPKFLEFIGVFLGSTFLVWINRLLIASREMGGDAEHYIEMAGGNWSIDNIVALYRPLTPLIARLVAAISGMDVMTAFEFANTLVLIATAMMFYYFLRDLKFSLPLRAIGAFLLLQSTIYVYLAWNPWLVDPLALLLLLAAMWAIIRGKISWFIVAIALSAANKEVYGFFTLPAFYVWNLDDGRIFDFKLLFKTALLALVPAAVLLCITESGVIPMPPPEIYPEGVGYWKIRFGSITPANVVKHTTEFRSLSFTKQNGVPHLIYSAWHILWVPALLGLLTVRREEKYARMWLPALLLLTLPWFLTPARLTAIQFLFVIPFALYEFRYLGRHLSKISSFAGITSLAVLYRLYALIDIRDLVHIKSLSDLGMLKISLGYYPIAYLITFAVLPILLHIMIGLKKTAE